MSYDLVTGDTGSILSVTILDKVTGLPKDLTDCSVLIRWEGDAAVVSYAMTITNALNGVVEYQFLANDIIAPKMRIEIEVTDGAGFMVTGTELIELIVREELG